MAHTNMGNRMLSIWLCHRTALAQRSRFIHPLQTRSDFETLLGFGTGARRGFSGVRESEGSEGGESGRVEEPKVLPAGITSKNFKDEFEREIKDAILKADFIALDLEMSGIESANFRRPCEIDTVQTRYLNYRHSAENFSIVQLGLCTFQWDGQHKHFLARPYNFHVFPRSTISAFRDLPVRCFLNQTNSLDFLSKHDIDLNTWVKDGISYLSVEQEKIVRKGLGLIPTSPSVAFNAHEPKVNNSESLMSSTSNIIFAEKVKRKLLKFREICLSKYDAELNSESALGENSMISIDSEDLHDPETNTIEGENLEDMNDEPFRPDTNSIKISFPYMTWKRIDSKCIEIIKQVAYNNFNDLIVVPDTDYEFSTTKIYFCKDENDKAKLMRELELERKYVSEMIVDDSIGVRKVIDIIQESGKPIVGHNFVLDLLHIHSKFISSLPSRVQPFSRTIRSCFPCVFDTKYMVRSSSKLRDMIKSDGSTLLQLYRASTRLIASNKTPHVKPAEDLWRYADSMRHHEAGFDAYMTGVVFSVACSILCTDPTDVRLLTAASALVSSRLSYYTPIPPHNLETLNTFTKPAMQVASMANLVCMGRKGSKEMVFDLLSGNEAVADRDLSGPKPKLSRLPDRKNVLLFWDIPESMTSTSLRKLIQSVFRKQEALIDLYFLDNSAALVEFSDRDRAEFFLKTLDLVVSKANAPQNPAALNFLKNHGISVAKFGAYEEICQSLLPFKTISEAANLLGYKFVSSAWIDYRNVKPSISSKLNSVNDELETLSGKFIEIFKSGSRPINNPASRESVPSKVTDVHQGDDNFFQKVHLSPSPPRSTSTSISAPTSLPRPLLSSPPSEPNSNDKVQFDDGHSSVDEKTLTELLRQRSNARMSRHHSNEDEVENSSETDIAAPGIEFRNDISDQNPSQQSKGTSQPSVSKSTASTLNLSSPSASSFSTSFSSLPDPPSSSRPSFSKEFLGLNTSNPSTELHVQRPQIDSFFQIQRKERKSVDDRPKPVPPTIQFQFSEDMLSRPQIRNQSDLLQSADVISRPKLSVSAIKLAQQQDMKIEPRAPTAIFRKDVVGADDAYRSTSNSMTKRSQVQVDDRQGIHKNNNDDDEFRMKHSTSESSLLSGKVSFRTWLEKARG